MEFTNPIAFWGMLALAVPTIILLLSKKKQTVVKFPSLKFLDESESRSARSIFPTQWLLWLLRIILISFLVLLLARPMFNSDSQKKKVYIEEEVFEDASFASVLSTLDSEIEVIKPESLWILAQKVTASVDSSIVYTRNYARNFLGKPLEIGSHVEWKIVPNENAREIQDTVVLENGTFETEIVTGEMGLKWTSKTIESVDDFKKKVIAIKILGSSKSQSEIERLSSILNKYSEVLPLEFDFGKESSKWLITIDTFIMGKGTNILQWDYQVGPLKLEEVAPDYTLMKGELLSENLERSDFAQQLAQLFMSEQLALDSLDHRLSPLPSVKLLEARPTSLRKSERKYYWWSISLILILIERWYSRKLASA